VAPDAETPVIPQDIALPTHLDATTAALHRSGDDWRLAFSGEPPFEPRDVPILAAHLTDAGIGDTEDRIVIGYIETRLLAAGYGLAEWPDPPPDAVEGWVLRR
jgi:hypothetical protein